MILFASGSAVAETSILHDAKSLIRTGDHKQAAHILKPASEAGDADASLLLANLHRQGNLGEAAKAEALSLFERAARQGSVDAMYLAGRMHSRGEFTTRNEASARTWLEAAKIAGHPLAANALAQLAPQKKQQKSGQSWGEAISTCDTSSIENFENPDGNVNLYRDALNCDNAVALFIALQARGISWSGTDEHGNSLLHAAVAAQHVLAVRHLVANGFDPLAESVDGWTPKSLALRSGNHELVALFSEKQGLDQSVEQISRAQSSGQFKGWQPLSIAAWHGRINQVSLLIEQGADINKEDINGHTALSRAIENKHSEVAKLLLKAGARIEQSRTNLNQLVALADSELTELYLSNHPTQLTQLTCDSLRQGNEAVLDIAIQRRWSANSICGEDTALITAIKGGSLTNVNTLVGAGAWADGSSVDQCNALCWASRLDRPELAKYLLNKDATFNVDIEGKTPLFYLVEHGRLDLTRELLQIGADVNHQSISGTFPLMIAARTNRPEILELLLDFGADPNQRNAAGDTALITAVRSKNYVLAKLLYDAGASARAHNNNMESAFKLSEQLYLSTNDKKWQSLFERGSNIWSIVQSTLR